MAQNYIAPGEVQDIVAPSGGIVTGQPVLVGSMVGVALTSAAQNATAAVQFCGAFRNLPKATGASWGVGDKIYWDNTAKNFTKTATSNTLAGYAYAAAASGDATGSVLLANGL